MATFKSPEVIINRTAEDFFTKISNLTNLQKIMPSTIQNFESTESTCSFKMQGMPEVNIKLGEKVTYSKISLTSDDSQVPFSLYCFITEKGNQCQARLEINAELNMMMRMMVEKPLTQFLNALASKMENF